MTDRRFSIRHIETRAPTLFLGAALVMVAIALIRPPDAGPTTVPSPSSDIASEAHSPSPSVARPSALADPSVIAPLPTVKPLPTPTPTPTPSSVLDWANTGLDLGVKSPVALGGAASVTITAGVGPTCRIEVRYPSGSVTTGGSPKHPKPGEWRWTWTIPASAGAGDAALTISCTFSGVTKTAESWIEIVAAATPAPGWTMATHAPSIWYWNDPNPMPIEVDIVGLLPGFPAGADVYLQCRFNIGFQTKSFILDVLQPFANGSGGFTYYADFGGPVGETEIGSARGYHVECFNYHGDPLTVQSDGGQFDVPAAPSPAPG